MMSKREFNLVAHIMHQQTERATTETMRRILFDIASALATGFAGVNIRFDRLRFLKACGFPHGELNGKERG